MGPLDPERIVRQLSWHIWQPEGNESKSDVIDCPVEVGLGAVVRLGSVWCLLTLSLECSSALSLAALIPRAAHLV